MGVGANRAGYCRQSQLLETDGQPPSTTSINASHHPTLPSTHLSRLLSAKFRAVRWASGERSGRCLTRATTPCCAAWASSRGGVGPHTRSMACVGG